MATAAVREARTARSSSAGSGKSSTSRSGSSTRKPRPRSPTARRPPLPPGRRAHARRRHRRREPRADRRGRRPGRVEHSRCPSVRCASPSCTCPATVGPEGSRELREYVRKQLEAAHLGPRLGSGHGHRLGRHLHQSRPHGRVATRGSRRAIRSTASPSRPPRWSSSSTGWSAGRLKQRAAGAGPQPASGPTSSSPDWRSRPSCSTGSRRASITVSAFGLREGLLLEMAGAEAAPAAADPLRLLPRVRRALPVRSAPRRAGPHPGAPALRSARARSSAARPRSACCSRRPRCCTTSASS